jgi:hypothetical protein
MRPTLRRVVELIRIDVTPPKGWFRNRSRVP